jgi:hypothetical protein
MKGLLHLESGGHIVWQVSSQSPVIVGLHHEVSVLVYLGVHCTESCNDIFLL